MSIGDQVITALKQTALFRFSGQLITWVATIFMMRLLSPEDYGLFAMTMFPQFVIITIADLGLGLSLIRAPHLSEGELRQMMGTIRITCLALWLVVTLCAPLMAAVTGDERATAVMRVMALQYIMYAFCLIPEALMRREMKFATISMMEFWTAIIGVLAGLGLAVQGAGVWALVTTALMPYFLKSIWINQISPVPLKPEYSISKLGEHLQFGRRALCSTLLNGTAWVSDAAIVGLVLGSAGGGQYVIAKQIATLPSEKLMPLVNPILFRAFARIQDDPAKISEQMLRVLRLLTVFSVPLGWGLASIAHELVLAVLGPKWALSIPIIQAIGLSMPLIMITTFTGILVQSLGRPEVSLWNSLRLFVALPVTVFLSARLGLHATMAVWLVFFPAVAIYNLRLELKVAGVNLIGAFTHVWPALLAGAFMVAVVIGIGRVTVDLLDEWLRLFALCAAGAATFLPLIYLLDRETVLDIYRLLIPRH